MAIETRAIINLIGALFAVYSGTYALTSLMLPKWFLRRMAIHDWTHGVNLKKHRSVFGGTNFTYVSFESKAKVLLLFIGGVVLGFKAADAILPSEILDDIGIEAFYIFTAKLILALVGTAAFSGVEKLASKEVGDFSPNYLQWQKEVQEAGREIRDLKPWEGLRFGADFSENQADLAGGAKGAWAKLGAEDAQNGLIRAELEPREEMQKLIYNRTECYGNTRADGYRKGWYTTVRELEDNGWRHTQFEELIGPSGGVRKR